MFLTYKTTLTSGQPYNRILASDYLSLLHTNKNNIYSGTFGVYLAREVVIDEQKLYQPLIDIDGASQLDGDSKIISAIQFAEMTLNTLCKLGADDHFWFLATGGTGFRAVSNLFFNHQAYLAFIDWIRYEMPHIHDLMPSVQTDIPHQIFAYKGDPHQTKKEIIDRHSTIIDKSILAQSAFSLDDYLQAATGKPDPDEIITFVEWLINGPVISDLNSIGPIGNRIEQYQRLATDITVNPFSYIQNKKKKEPVGLIEMQDLLLEKGIVSTIEHRGQAQAISFRGLPCPVCGKSSANARAYPPGYQLRCFNVNCEAHNGMSLYRWTGIKNEGGESRSSQNGFDLSAPESFVSMNDARDLIVQELNNHEDDLIVMTPGVGKTHTAMQTIAGVDDDRVVIYGAFNKALQKEAHDKIRELAGNDNRYYLLQSREETCLRPVQLNEITSRGFAREHYQFVNSVRPNFG